MPNDYVLGDPNKKKPTIGTAPQPSAPGPQIPGPVYQPDYTLGNGQNPSAGASLPPIPPSAPGRQFPGETQVESPTTLFDPGYTLGTGPIPGRTPPSPGYTLGNGQPPAAGAVPQPPPAVGGSADFPSLPPGAVPPPGYYDPQTGKTAPMPGAAPTAAPTAPAPAAPAAPTAAPAGTPAAPGAPPDTIADAYKKALTDMLERGGQTPTLNDPTLKAQSDAFAVGQTRASEAQRAQMAERAASQGGTGVNSGAFETGISDLQERQGESQGAFNANLVGEDAKARRQELLQAAALAGNQLNAEEARALQRELATLDATIKREGLSLQDKLGGIDAGLRGRGLDLQGELGRGDLALRGRLGEGQLNAQLLSILTGDRFNRDSLAQQGAQFGAGLDTQTILAMLGGLG